MYAYMNKNVKNDIFLFTFRYHLHKKQTKQLEYGNEHKDSRLVLFAQKGTGHYKTEAAGGKGHRYPDDESWDREETGRFHLEHDKKIFK